MDPVAPITSSHLRVRTFAALAIAVRTGWDGVHVVEFIVRTGCVRSEYYRLDAITGVATIAGRHAFCVSLANGESTEFEGATADDVAGVLFGIDAGDWGEG
jgi:hypothetical protein